MSEEDDGPEESPESPFDELLERIAEDEDFDSASDVVDAEFETLEEGTDSPANTGDASPTSFTDLLDRVRVREDQRDDVRHTDDHDLNALPAAANARTVLFTGVLGSKADDAACLSALAGGGDLPTRRVLLVTTTPWGKTRLEVFLDRYDEDDVAELAHVGRQADEAPSRASIHTAELSDPEDLVHLGINVSRIVESWDDSVGSIAVCVHSLSPLIQQGSPRRAFRFLHVLLGRLGEADARVHVHLDAEAHDPEEIALFRQLFDVTVEVTEDGLDLRS